jgi:hypothetical protein
MTQEIDEHTLSRLLAVHGADTQRKLMVMKVFLLGLRGVFVI